MAEIYGHRWTSAFGEDAATGAGQTWAHGLTGLTAAQIGDGIERMLIEADDWPPTLPQFRRLCLGVPSLPAVSFELRQHDGDKSPFARLVWSRLDGYAFGRADQAHAERMLRDAYLLAREHVMAGGELPALVNYLEHASTEPPIPATRETVEQHMAEIAQTLGATRDLRSPDPAPPRESTDCNRCWPADCACQPITAEEAEEVGYVP